MADSRFPHPQHQHQHQHQPPVTTTKHIHSFDGFLFDLDGTVIDTTEAITRHWITIGDELGVDAETILASSRGRRSIDTLALCGEKGKERANWGYIHHIEPLIPALHGSTATPTPNAHSLLTSLTQSTAPWALVTSCSRPLLSAWLEHFNLPVPRVSVAAEDVSRGKPEGDCYVLGIERMFADDDDDDGKGGGKGEGKKVLVVEDSPAGVKAGKAAGCMVLAVETTHEGEVLGAAGADWVVRDLSRVRFVGRKEGVGEGEGEWEVEIDDGDGEVGDW